MTSALSFPDKAASLDYRLVRESPESETDVQGLIRAYYGRMFLLYSLGYISSKWKANS